MVFAAHAVFRVWLLTSMVDPMAGALMLSGPVEAPVAIPYVGREWLYVQSSVVTAALTQGIMDERERSYLLTRRLFFPADMALLRARRESLRDAPDITDACRFPSRGEINKMIEFNRQFLTYLQGRRELELDRRQRLDQVIVETQAIYRTLDTARDVQGEYYYTSARRESLKRLRDLLGPVDYAAGRLPPPAPYHRFREMQTPVR